MKVARIVINTTVVLGITGLLMVGVTLLERPSNALEWVAAAVLLLVMMVGHGQSMNRVSQWAVQKYAYLRLIRALRREAKGVCH